MPHRNQPIPIQETRKTRPSMPKLAGTIYLIRPSDNTTKNDQASSPSPWLVMAKETTSPGKIQFCHALTRKRVEKGSIDINYLARFKVHELAKVYGYGSKKDVECTCEYPARVMDSFGRVHECDRSTNNSSSCVWSWDDVVIFKGKKMGVDRHGLLYVKAQHNKAQLLVAGPVCEGGPMGSRKRLVVNTRNDKLHLVVRKHAPASKAGFKLEVYELNEELNEWSLMEKLGTNRVLFAGLDCCFFAQVRDFSGGCNGNCIVFAEGSFHYQSLVGAANAEERIWVYRFRKGNRCSLLLDHPGLPEMLWPPPQWFSCSQQNTAQKQGGDQNMGDLHGSQSLCWGKRKRRRVSWSKLSSELILAISKHLKTKTDVVSFRQVCKRWCKYSVPNPVNYFSYVLPCPILASETTPRLPFHHLTRPLSLHVSSVYLITPSQSENNEKNKPPLVQFKPWMVVAEEANPGIIRLRHPLTGKRVKDYPPTLNLTRFRTTDLAEGYNFKHSNSVHKVVLHSTSSLTSVEALVLYEKGSLGKLTLEKNDNEDCEWRKLKVRKGRKFWFLYLDDVVSFKGMICGVDRKGKLYMLDHEEMTVGPVLVPDKLCRGEQLTARRKRLVVDPTSGELHLVVREHVQVKARFRVYRFNEHHHRWDHMVDGIGRDRVLFVGVAHCFFAKVKDFPRCNGIGNCIVFAANCFTQYCGIDFPDRCLFGMEDEDVGVYRLGEEDNFRSISTFPEFSQMIWPPPTWFRIKREYSNKKDETESSSCSEESEMRCSSNTSLPDEQEEEILSDSTSEDDSGGEEDDSVEVEAMQSESSQKASKASRSNTSHPDEHEEEILADSSSEEKSGGKEDDNAEDEETQSESSGQQAFDADEEEAQIGSYGDQTQASEVSLSDETGGASSEPVPEEPAEMNCDPTSPVNFEEKNVRTPHKNDPVHEKEIPQEKALANSMLVTPTLIQVHMPVTSPTSQNSVSTVKFHGVEIKAHLLPTLETIWAKHGNLVGEDTVRSKDLLACALESLAKMIITLQNTTARTLTDLQANELRSNLFDLQRMGLKVDWLLPIIDKALALNKSKPLIESLVAIDKAKAEADEREKKFLAESAKVKQELEENRAYLSTRIPFTEPIDLDECLAQGLC